MGTHISVRYEQILNLAYLLNVEDKMKLIEDLNKSLKSIKEKKGRNLGQYDGQGWISDDFNEPLEDFKEYMP